MSTKPQDDSNEETPGRPKIPHSASGGRTTQGVGLGGDKYPVHKTDAEWRSQLDPMQYQVARHAATERPFTGQYWDHFQPGRYDCIGCGTPLFESAAKFDAGCGWPSYAAPIHSDVIEQVRDASHGMLRIEVRCRNCGSHLGHVFDDGPAPAGERYCINSAAIDFAPPD